MYSDFFPAWQPRYISLIPYIYWQHKAVQFPFAYGYKGGIAIISRAELGFFR